MGYCYDADGKLCCDVCSESGGVRKHRCPFGYCQPIALCPKCKREHPEYVSKAYHRENGCEANHLRFQQEEAQRQQLLDSGKLLRCSALQHNGRVKVIFRGKNGKERAFWMAPRTYRRIALGVPATPQDFKALGKVTRAKTTDIYDSEGKVKEAQHA